MAQHHGVPRESYDNGQTSTYNTGTTQPNANTYYVENEDSYSMCQMPVYNDSIPVSSNDYGNIATSKADYDGQMFKAEFNDAAARNDYSDLPSVNKDNHNVSLPRDNYVAEYSTGSTRRRATKRRHVDTSPAISMPGNSSLPPVVSFLPDRDTRELKPDDPDLEFFKGLVPQVKELTPKNKRIYFKTIANTLFDMIDKQEDETDTDNSSMCK